MTPMDTFRVRLNCIDHYQAVPNPDFDPPVPRDLAWKDAKARPRVSIIRVFGATQTGQKVLMHVHGAFQYTYIEYSGSLIQEDVNNAIRTLHMSLDHALAVSYRKNIYDGNHQYVAHISLVKGIPFYGYHVGYKFYLKIYLLNPLHMTRLADLLREGAVMKRVLQPYESHMQYLAQWMCDYNLYGCAYIDCERVKFRSPVPSYHELNSAFHEWHDLSIQSECISDEGIWTKQSHCALEVDVCVQDILNRQGIETRPIHHDFIERLHPSPWDAKLVQSMAGLWKDETRRRKARMGLIDPKSSPFPPEVLITMSADPRNARPGGWIHEEEYREKVTQLAADEHERSDKSKLKFGNFVKSVPLESSVKTALESVEDLYPEKTSVASAEERTGQHGTLRSPPYVNEAPIDDDRASQVTEDSTPDLENMQYLKTVAAENTTEIMDDINEQNITVTNPNHSQSEISQVMSSAEMEILGVRKAGDFSQIQEEDFKIPAEYLNVADKPFKKGFNGKRALASVSASRKRRKFITNADDSFMTSKWSDSRDSTDSETVFADMDGKSRLCGHAKTECRSQKATGIEGQVNRDVQFGYSPRTVLSTPSDPSQKPTLSFTVVKDPNDPITILRLSQQSSTSQRVSQKISQKGVGIDNQQNNSRTESLSAVTREARVSTGIDKSSNPSRLGPICLKMLPKPREGNRTLSFHLQAPSWRYVETTMGQEGLPDVIYQEAYYSNQKDVPERQREYAGREFKLGSTTVPYLPDFDFSGQSLVAFGHKEPTVVDEAFEASRDSRRRQDCSILHWSIAKVPPTQAEVSTWVQNDLKQTIASRLLVHHKVKPLSQVDGPTQKNKYGFEYTQNSAGTSVQHETQYMSLMSLEVHVNTRGALTPNPEEDEVACIFWCVQTDDEEHLGQSTKEGMHTGILALENEPGMAKRIARIIAVDVEDEKTELDLLTRIVDIVRHFDPDILTGYEVHNSSWGYLIERARLKYDMNLCDELSRMKTQSHGRFGKDDDKWGFNHTSTIRVTGRHTINIWRAMRGELNLLQYTMENVVYQVLHRRIPHYSFADLSRWYKSKKPRDLAKVIEYFASRVQMDLEILDANELVPRTSEQARLLGVDWFSVISRGSQFKVESLMFRIAKPENFILVSPSRRQVGGQNALECLPLVMEPQSDFYTSPLLVLDFQSLYPSVMIAYNYCYSTFLGRIVSWRGTNKMGFTDYRREQRLIELLKDHINIAPNGIMYAKPEVRKSLLAKMLSEILETRVMVKSGMKVEKDDKILQRLLNNRQLALKLIANVTYGYTSASFSGRMPCSEIADSIVQTGRETLEKAIALIHSIERWGAEVVYGDTDSLFVYLKGRTRDQAFDIGEEIAAAVTKLNPRPVKLKFEKVYHPCVLLAKKRYVGFKYEHRDQQVPEFDAKGIETVRRDGTPAEQKIEETAIKILFRTSDLSQVKKFFQTQCSKIMRGKVSIQDFCFAKEVKLGTYSDKGPPPPGALISARKMLEDPRLEPQYGERVPYVVVTGGPGARLIDRCVAPEVLLDDAQSELDAEYYISKNIIPPLERIFNLVGANVRQWYDEMPKYQRIRRVEAGIFAHGKELGTSKRTLESYMRSSICIVCHATRDSAGLPICSSCHKAAPRSLLLLRAKLAKAEKTASQLGKVCRSCSGLSWNEEVRCDSKDCSVFYSRTRHLADMRNTISGVMPVVRALEVGVDRNEDDGADGVMNW